jgi:hypothetical protein
MRARLYLHHEFGRAKWLAVLREAVFSSTGFRIRDSQGQVAKKRLAKTGWAGPVLIDPAKYAVASLFFSFFPADRRISNPPLIKFSRLPVCVSCLAAAGKGSAADAVFPQKDLGERVAIVPVPLPKMQASAAWIQSGGIACAGGVGADVEFGSPAQDGKRDWPNSAPASGDSARRVCRERRNVDSQSKHLIGRRWAYHERDGGGMCASFAGVGAGAGSSGNGGAHFDDRRHGDVFAE